jgi:hypothetical protein
MERHSAFARGFFLLLPRFINHHFDYESDVSYVSNLTNESDSTSSTLSDTVIIPSSAFVRLYRVASHLVIPHMSAKRCAGCRSDA